MLLLSAVVAAGFWRVRPLEGKRGWCAYVVGLKLPGLLHQVTREDPGQLEYVSECLDLLHSQGIAAPAA